MSTVKLLVVCVVGLAACADQAKGPAPNTIDGKVAGNAVAVTDVSALVRSERGLLDVVFSDQPLACSALAINQQTPNAAIFALGVSNQVAVTGGTAPAMPTAPGVYPVYASVFALPDQPGPIAICGYEALDHTCTGTEVACQSGKVTITAIDTSAGGRIAGTFDVTLTTGDHLIGDFDTTSCEADPSEPAATCE